MKVLVRLVALIGALSIHAVPAQATVIELRTVLVSAASAFASAGGASSAPVLSQSGAVVAFESAAPDLVGDDRNGAVVDVFTVNVATGERRLVSAGLDGAGGDGPSRQPALSASGERVAFTSTATNLAPGDDLGSSDVFVRDGTGVITMVSVTRDGRPGNGASSNPDLSADGRFVVFESDATDLVDGDFNLATDVFVRDLATRQTTRVSLTRDGFQADGGSHLPAISADGRVVSFESSAANLVADDTNRVPDVFVRSLRGRTTERVSISSDGEQQNRAVTPPFHMISDLDGSGRLVAFDTEASNLTPDDTNRASDVFTYDRVTDEVRLVSASTANIQGNNDSVSPVMTPDGRFVAFQSFATNLAPDDPTGADIVVRDLRLRATSLVSVTASGSRRQPEIVGQVLQRPALSADASIAAFVSTAPNLAAGDTNRAADVFLRLMAPPRTLGRRTSSTRATVGADDRGARRFLCFVGTAVPRVCGPRVALTGRGGRMTIRATGPGMLVDPDGVSYATRPDVRPPVVRVTKKASGSSRRVSGTVTDVGGSGVASVEIAVTYSTKDRRCLFLSARTFTRTKNCRIRRFQRVAVTRNTWTLLLPRDLPTGAFVGVFARARDTAGNRSRTVEAISLIR